MPLTISLFSANSSLGREGSEIDTKVGLVQLCGHCREKLAYLTDLVSNLDIRISDSTISDFQYDEFRIGEAQLTPRIGDSYIRHSLLTQILRHTLIWILFKPHGALRVSNYAQHFYSNRGRPVLL